jgi:hypothetical protein
VGTSLTLLSSIVLTPRPIESTSFSIPDLQTRLLVLGLIIAGILVYLFVGFTLSFRYLCGRGLFYSNLSQIIWEHMGTTAAYAWTADPYVEKLEQRALRMGIHRAVITLFEARLFATRCRRRHLDYQVTEENLRAFDAAPELVKRENDYKGSTLRLWRNDEMLFLAYKATIKSLLDSKKKENERRGKLLKLRFEAMPCPDCGNIIHHPSSMGVLLQQVWRLEIPCFLGST